MKKSFQLIALMAIALLGSCSGDKDKTAAEKVVVEKQKVKLALGTAVLLTRYRNIRLRWRLK